MRDPMTRWLTKATIVASSGAFLVWYVWAKVATCTWIA